MAHVTIQKLTIRDIVVTASGSSFSNDARAESFGNTFSNCRFGNGGTINLRGTNHKFVGCTLNGDVVVNASGMNLADCEILGDLTFIPSSSGNYFSGVRLQGSVTDLGTDNAGSFF